MNYIKTFKVGYGDALEGRHVGVIVHMIGERKNHVITLYRGWFMFFTLGWEMKL